MTDIPTPSKAIIEKAILSNYDGSKIRSLDIITEINFSQSIDASAYMGSIKLQDNIGLMETFPLRGEERLQLTIVSNDLQTKKKLDLQIYKIDNVVINDANDGVSYYMHFVSRTSFNASKRRVIESFKTPISEIAKKIFEKYFGGGKKNTAISLPLEGQRYVIPGTNESRSFIIQPTEGTFKGIIPNYTPTEAMYFLSTRAFVRAGGFTSCSYRFFETLDDYYFVSDEYLIKKALQLNEVINLTYLPQTSKDIKDLEQQILNLEVLEYSHRVDSANDLYSGAYTNRVMEIDFMRKKFRFDEKYFDYLEDADFYDMNGNKKTKNIQTSIHTTQFIRDTFTEENAKRYILFRDYGELGDIPGPLRGEQYLSEITSRRTSYIHHLNNTVINASLTGRLDINAGNIVNLSVYEFTSSDNRKLNPQVSGNYLVHTINHSIINDEINTNMKLIKYDWST